MSSKAIWLQKSMLRFSISAAHIILSILFLPQSDGTTAPPLTDKNQVLDQLNASFQAQCNMPIPKFQSVSHLFSLYTNKAAIS